jgi:hypothetical protein
MQGKGLIVRRAVNLRRPPTADGPCMVCWRKLEERGWRGWMERVGCGGHPPAPLKPSDGQEIIKNIHYFRLTTR